MERLLREEDIINAMGSWDWQELYLPIHFKQLLEEVDGIPMYDWTPCSSNMMPEAGQTVWISTKGGYVETAIYIPNRGMSDYIWECEFSYLRKDEVLAWMTYEAPNPYVPEEE